MQTMKISKREAKVLEDLIAERISILVAARKLRLSGLGVYIRGYNYLKAKRKEHETFR